MSDLYYKTPTQEQFDEVKSKATEIWLTYDNTYGYASEKIDRIKDLGNISDNIMVIVAMFDGANQAKLARMLSPETKKAIADRLKAGGNPDYFNPFL